MSSVVALRPWTEMLKESVNRVGRGDFGFFQETAWILVGRLAGLDFSSPQYFLTCPLSP